MKYFFDNAKKAKKSAKELESELEKTDKIKVKEIMDPLWSTGSGRQKKANHRHASPIPPVKRFISLFFTSIFSLIIFFPLSN